MLGSSRPWRSIRAPLPAPFEVFQSLFFIIFSSSNRKEIWMQGSRKNKVFALKKYKAHVSRVRSSALIHVEHYLKVFIHVRLFKWAGKDSVDPLFLRPWIREQLYNNRLLNKGQASNTQLHIVVFCNWLWIKRSQVQTKHTRYMKMYFEQP